MNNRSNDVAILDKPDGGPEIEINYIVTETEGQSSEHWTLMHYKREEDKWAADSIYRVHPRRALLARYSCWWRIYEPFFIWSPSTAHTMLAEVF